MGVDEVIRRTVPAKEIIVGKDLKIAVQAN